jgi:hypothetical protein
LAKTDAQYIIDHRGRKKAVILNIKEYSRLLDRVEELEDALDLDNAVRSAHEFKDYKDIREELHQEGQL